MFIINWRIILSREIFACCFRTFLFRFCIIMLQQSFMLTHNLILIISVRHNFLSGAWLLIFYYLSFSWLRLESTIFALSSQWAISSFLQQQNTCIDINQNGGLLPPPLVKSHTAAADPLTLFQFFTIILFWTFTTLQNSTFGTISRKSISNLKSASAMHFCMFLLIRFFLEKIQLEKLPNFFFAAFNVLWNQIGNSFAAAACYDL